MFNLATDLYKMSSVALSSEYNLVTGRTFIYYLTALSRPVQLDMIIRRVLTVI